MSGPGAAQVALTFPSAGLWDVAVIADDGEIADGASIDETLGGNKVRSFFNNIIDPDGDVIEGFEPEEWSTAVTPETAADLTAMMVLAVQSGTGVAAQIPGISVAGKTGTAETGVAGRNNTWFVAFAPAENPEVAVAVALSDQAGTGGATAAPIARAIIEAALGRNT